MKYQKQFETMLRDIANYFEARFLAEPTLENISFSSTRELCLTLRRANVPLWLWGDAGIARKLGNPLLIGPLREYLGWRLPGSVSWVFSRPERLNPHV